MDFCPKICLLNLQPPSKGTETQRSCENTMSSSTPNEPLALNVLNNKMYEYSIGFIDENCPKNKSQGQEVITN